MLHQLYLSAKLNTVAHLDAQANKKPKVSKVGATQYYHFLFCIGKRGATRSVENPFGFWIRRGECISVAPSARPHFGSKMRFRFLAVCIRQSSTAFRDEPWRKLLIARAERVVTLNWIVRSNLRASSAPFGRGSKNQKFSLPFFLSSAGGVGGADKKW